MCLTNHLLGDLQGDCSGKILDVPNHLLRGVGGQDHAVEVAIPHVAADGCCPQTEDRPDSPSLGPLSYHAPVPGLCLHAGDGDCTPLAWPVCLLVMGTALPLPGLSVCW
ncbi:hypothetical protein ACOMHN_044632 [Nucella lapillus]